VSCIDFSVSQTSSDDLNFFAYFLLLSFLCLSLPLHPLRFLSDSSREAMSSCLLTGVLKPGSDAVAVLIYHKVIFGNQAKSLTFRSGVLNGDLVFA